VRLSPIPFTERGFNTHPRFILNGLAHANAIFNSEVFHLPDWKIIGEYVYDSDGGRHQAFVVPVRDVRVLGVDIPAYERVQIEQSLKYSPAGSEKMWKLAGLEEVACWRKVDDYGEIRSPPSFVLVLPHDVVVCARRALDVDGVGLCLVPLSCHVACMP
jgi:hypothetical protein